MSMTSQRPLKLNWIEGRPTLSGGIKSNRLIAEAMQRRGHEVTTSFLPPSWAWPKPWRIRSMYKRIRRGVGAKHFPHHLQTGEINLNQMPTRELNPDLIPDADVTFASWWAVWDQVKHWPESKGLKVHYARGYETFNADTHTVEQAYKLPGPRIVISSWLGEILKGFGHQDIVRVPNGVDWDQFDSKPRSKPTRPTIGMLMGPAQIKDTPTGIRAIRRLLQEFPDLRVLGFGTRDLPSDFDVPDCVEFHKCPAQSLIPELYRQATCWVMTSTSEGFGMPGIEAMASHCPIVSTDSGGPADFVREGINGYIVPIADDQLLAERIGLILKLDDQAWCAMSTSSYQIAKEFSWDRSAEILEQTIYQWLDHPNKEWDQ